MEEPQNKTQTHKAAKPRQRALFGFIIFVVAIIAVTIISSVIVKNRNDKPVPQASVRITATGFEPATLSVKKGTQITWINTQDTLRQIMANPFPKGTDLPGLKSEILNNNQTYTYTANTVGSFGYHDQQHPTVNGTLIVKKP
jgi:plastocyanin